LTDKMKKYLMVFTTLCAVMSSLGAHGLSTVIPGMPNQVPSDDNTVAFTCVNDGSCFTIRWLYGHYFWIDVHWAAAPIHGQLVGLQDGAGQMLAPEALISNPQLFGQGLVIIKKE
jgi:hypothetical protein